MKRFVVTVCTLTLLVCISGCGSDADAETKKYIDQMNALSEAIEKKDEAKALSVAKDLKETEKKLKEIKVTESENKKIIEKYKDDLTKAIFRFLAASMSNPELAKKVDYQPSK